MRTANGMEDGDWAYDFVVAWLVRERGGGPSDYLPEMPLDLLHLDSLDYVEFVMGVEDKFETVAPDPPGGIRTVGNLAEWIRRIGRR